MGQNNRDTFKYVLKNYGEVVYVGITNDPDRRLEEHRSNKLFTSMVLVGNRTTLAAAKKWELERLATYRRNHGGRNPKYNQTNHG